MAVALGEKLETDWDSLSPLDVVRGGTWRSGLFLTFALSLGFFEAILWPHLRRAGIRQVDIFADLVGVRDALGESGAREVGRSYTVHPCWVFEGVFHPKLTALEGEHPHLLIGSGNLTFGGWGANAEVIEHLVPQVHPAAFMDAAGFLEDLATSPRLRLVDAEPLARWSYVLARAGRGAEEGAVRLLHNVQRPICDQLADHAEALGGAVKVLVVSPYFGGSAAVNSLARRLGVDRIEVHVPQALPYHGEVFPFAGSSVASPVEVDLLRPETAAGDRPLHAKVIEIVCRRGRVLLSGSVNASTPALATARNVELAVLRIDGASATTLERTAVARPNPIGASAEGEAAGDDRIVLFARAHGSTVAGTLMGHAVSGLWTAYLVWSGARTDYGEVEVSADGSFTMEGVDLSDVSYGGGRATLRLRRGDRVAEGFLAVTDNLELGRTVGAVAGPMMRTAAGSGDDEDLAAVLEWMAMNPDESLQPWRTSMNSPGRPEDGGRLVDPARAQIISDTDLDAIRTGPAGSAPSAIERLLARLRLQIQAFPSAATPALRMDHQELEDLIDEDGEPLDPHLPQRADPVIGVFDRIWSVLRERVPLDPPSELMRLAEIGAHVALRRHAPQERLARMIDDWTHLAISHLDPTVGTAPVQLARALVVLSAALDGAVGRARRRLLHLASGSLREATFDIELEDASLASRLVSASVGLPAYTAALEAIREARSAFDDLMMIRAAVTSQTALPTLAVIEAEPEIKQVRRWLDRGRPEMIVLLDHPIDHCPRHFSALPTSQAYRLSGAGLATPDCCDRVLVNLRP